MEKILVKKITEEVIERIKQMSAYGLPDRPSERGMSASEIKRAFYEPILAAETSIAAEVNRVVDEINEALPRMAEYISLGSEGEEQSLKEIIEKLLEGLSEEKLLPAVDENDNGKFLRVEGGIWAAVEIPYAEGEEY